MNKIRRSQEERRHETRTKLIKATITVINEKGYAAMRTGDITKKAGVTWGAAQHLFGSREDLMMHVSTSVSDGLADMLETHIDLSLPTKERLETIIDKTWGVYNSDAYFAMIEIIRGTRKDFNVHDRLVQAQMKISKKIEKLWIKLFAEGMSANDNSVQQILQVCNLVTLFLSGLAARKIYLFPAAQTKAHIAFIKGVAIREIKQTE